MTYNKTILALALIAAAIFTTTTAYATSDWRTACSINQPLDNLECAVDHVESEVNGALAAIANHESRIISLESITVVNGTDGSDGQDGINGTDGATGPAGPQGPQGPQGVADALTLSFIQNDISDLQGLQIFHAESLNTIDTLLGPGSISLQTSSVLNGLTTTQNQHAQHVADIDAIFGINHSLVSSSVITELQNSVNDNEFAINGECVGLICSGLKNDVLRLEDADASFFATIADKQSQIDDLEARIAALEAIHAAPVPGLQITGYDTRDSTTLAMHNGLDSGVIQGTNLDSHNPGERIAIYLTNTGSSDVIVSDIDFGTQSYQMILANAAPLNQIDAFGTLGLLDTSFQAFMIGTHGDGILPATVMDTWPGIITPGQSVTVFLKLEQSFTVNDNVPITIMGGTTVVANGQIIMGLHSP